MIENADCFGSLRIQFEPDDRVDAGAPVRQTPCLHNSLAGDQFDVATGDQATEGRKGPGGLAVNLSWHAGKRSKQLGIEQQVIETLRAGFEGDLLMKEGAARVGCRGRHLLHLWQLVFGPE